MTLTKNGLFFWRRKKPSLEQRTEEFLAVIAKHGPAIRKAFRGGPHEETEGEMIGKMYDFFVNWDERLPGLQMDMDAFDAQPSSEEIKKDERIVATPLSVMKELETVPVPFTLEGLDEKIASLKDKEKLLNQRYAGEQIKGLIKRLENRKSYRENVAFYSSFPNTTDEKIDALLAKYKLVIKTSDLFIPTFPKDAIDVMKKYIEVTEKMCKEKPVFYVIAEQKDFQKKNEKLDPILLAQSPFGFYWQILGAWDKEMLLLSEL